MTGGLELVSGLVCLSTVSLNLMWDNSIPASFAHYYSQCSEYPLWCKSVGQTGGERGELVSTYPALPSSTQHYLDRPTTNGRSAGHSPGRLAQLCVTTRGGEGEVSGGRLRFRGGESAREERWHSGTLSSPEEIKTLLASHLAINTDRQRDERRTSYIYMVYCPNFMVKVCQPRLTCKG